MASVRVSRASDVDSSWIRVDDVTSERELRAMQQCAAGHGAGLDTLHRLHAGACVSLARKVVREEHHAQVAVQEAFLEVWRHAGRYDGLRATPRCWLLTLTYRRAVDRVRGEPHRSAGVLTGMHDLRPGLDLGLALRAVGDLPRAQADALALAYWGGLSQSEIAVLLAVPLATVKTRTRAGLRRLGATLSPAGVVS